MPENPSATGIRHHPTLLLHLPLRLPEKQTVSPTTDITTHPCTKTPPHNHDHIDHSPT